MHVLSRDEALSILLVDDADDQAKAPLNEGREIVIALSEQDLRTIELSLCDVVVSMDRREFTDHMPLDVHEALRWADDLRLLRQSVFGEREAILLSLPAVRARRIDWAAWSEVDSEASSPRTDEAWFCISEDDLAVMSSAVRHATDRDPAVMNPVDGRLTTDDTVGRALRASFESMARNFYRRA
jgi:hypothetical protein